MTNEQIKIYRWIVSISGGAVALALGMIAFGSQLTNRENAILGILITVLTTLASWLMSRHYAIIGNEQKAAEKIDTVATQSSEKILNLSKQLFDIQRFLEETVLEAHSQHNVMAANGAFLHRTEAAAQMVSLLRSSNDTFTSDWTGVVSPIIKTQIEGQKKLQANVIREIESVTNTHKIDRAGDGDDFPTGIYNALSKISEQAAHLPESIRPEIRIPAVSVQQQTQNASEDHQDGVIALTIHRPIFMATGSGKLMPEMIAPPRIFARLTSPPIHDNPLIGVHSGAGTRYDFNVHIKSKEYNRPIQPGRYVLSYTADAVGGDDEPPAATQTGGDPSVISG